MKEFEKKWERFLSELRNSKKEFDKDLLEYLEALKYVSEITTDNIDNMEERKRINSKLKCISEFIEKYKDDYYEIGLIQGFKTNGNDAVDNDNEDGNDDMKDDGRIAGRDYYYYISDQKMKASVYYVRYLNFIDRISNNNEEDFENIPKWINEINTKLEGKWKISDNAEEIDKQKQISDIIEAVENYLPDDSEALDIRQKCHEMQLGLESEKNTEYKKYMMFNNMMREIRYTGAAYQHLWHWEAKKKNLFRNVTRPSVVGKVEGDCAKKEFLSDMFKKVIGHMNHPNRELCSYSEDPFIDIYKYLKIKKIDKDSRPGGEYDVDSDGIRIRFEKLDNPNNATFEIIKSVMVNSVKRGEGQAKDFYSFIHDGIKLNPTEKLAYAVEIFPVLKAEKNSKKTTKNIKSLLVTYLNSWDPEGAKNLMSYVADDKEVITYGIIESEEYDINNLSEKPAEYVEGCKYTMKMDKDEVIYLLLTLKNIDKSGIPVLVEKLKRGFKFKTEGITYDGYRIVSVDRVKEIFGNSSIENDEIIEGNITIEVLSVKQRVVSVSIPVKAVITPTYFNSISVVNGEESTPEQRRRITQEKMKELIQPFFEKRYGDILDKGKEKKYPSADFIIDFIKKEGYKRPSYIGEYNEYDFDKFDEEISILKYLIFKKES